MSKLCDVAMGDKMVIEEKFMLKEMLENLNDNGIQLISKHCEKFIEYLDKKS